MLGKPKKANKKFTWNVEGTKSVPHSNGNSYQRNISYQVFSETLEGAIQAVRDRDADFVFVKVFRDRWVEDVIVAPCP